MDSTTTTTTTSSTTGKVPLGQRTHIVHKADAEGALIIDALQGNIVQPIDERPEWSEGLFTALIPERYRFYSTRLGKEYADTMTASDEPIDFADLGWLGVDADGNPGVELSADPEFRMNVIASHLKLHRPNDLSNIPHDDTKGELGHALVDMNTIYDAEDVTAMENAGAEVTEHKTGTK